MLHSVNVLQDRTCIHFSAFFWHRFVPSAIPVRTLREFLKFFCFLNCNVVSVKVECELYRSPFHKTILFTFYFSQSPVNSSKMSSFFHNANEIKTRIYYD